MEQEKEKQIQEIVNQKNPNPAARFWNWLWHSNSILSWIVALGLAFVIVKFIFFPCLSLVAASSLPLVVVESSSMSHPGSFVGNVIQSEDSFLSWWDENKNWYEQKGINEEQAEQWSLKTGLEKGDIVFVYGRGEPEIGDIIIFNANQKHPLIHRIVDIKENGNKVYSTKGDNNQEQLLIEKQIPKDALIGKAVFRIPLLGWVKLVFVEIIKAFS